MNDVKSSLKFSHVDTCQQSFENHRENEPTTISMEMVLASFSHWSSMFFFFHFVLETSVQQSGVVRRILRPDSLSPTSVMRINGC